MIDMLDKQIKKHIKQLQQKKYRKEYNEFLVEGIKGIQEALRSSYEVVALVIDGKKRDEQDIQSLILLSQKKDTEVFFAGRGDIDEIKTTETFSGVLAVVAMQDIGLQSLEQGKPIVCIDGINDPGNLGTIIRTADWFGISSILLGEGSVDPYNDKVVRSTMGSFFRSQVFTAVSLVHSLEKLKRDGYSLYALDTHGTPVSHSLHLPKKSVFVFGSESHGIRPEIQSLCDQSFTIVGTGKAESLNVGVAVGITLSYL